MEAGKMAEVCKHAICTVSATGALSGDLGCFSTCSLAPLCLSVGFMGNPFPSIPGESLAICLDRWEDHFSLVQQGPLSSRGWTFQERVLSPRVLHYLSGRIFWECEEVFASEFRQNWFGPRRDWRRLYEKSSLIKVSDPENGLRFYHDFVQEYTSRKPTFTKDKLVAFSSVTKEVQKLMQTDYLAGLWRSQLFTELLWYRKHYTELDRNHPNHPRLNSFPPSDQSRLK